MKDSGGGETIEIVLDKDSATKTAYRLLEEIPELSYGDKNSENLLIQGDNLEALKALIPFYAGKVKYILKSLVSLNI